MFITNTLRNGDSVSCQVTRSGLCGYASFIAAIITVKTTGISHMSTLLSDIRLMPNPNNGLYIINGTLASAEEHAVSIEVTNMIGRVVYRSNVTTTNSEINVSVKLDDNLANGIYLLNVRTSTENKVLHFVVKH